MKIATVIVYHPKLTLYLDAVKKCFEHWGRVFTVEADFKEVSEEEARNQGLQQTEDCDFVWTIDSDEFLLRADQDRILKDAVRCDRVISMVKVVDYFSPTEIMDPPRPSTPIVLVKPALTKFDDGRCAPGNKREVPGCFMHHFGLMYPPEIQEWKRLRYWNKSDPKEYEKLLKSEKKISSIPDEVKALLDEHTFKENANDDIGSVNNAGTKEKKRTNRRDRTLDAGRGTRKS